MILYKNLLKFREKLLGKYYLLNVYFTTNDMKLLQNSMTNCDERTQVAIKDEDMEVIGGKAKLNLFCHCYKVTDGIACTLITNSAYRGTSAYGCMDNMIMEFRKSNKSLIDDVTADAADDSLEFGTLDELFEKW